MTQNPEVAHSILGHLLTFYLSLILSPNLPFYSSNPFILGFPFEKTQNKFYSFPKWKYIQDLNSDRYSVIVSGCVIFPLVFCFFFSGLQPQSSQLFYFTWLQSLLAFWLVSFSEKYFFKEIRNLR